MKLILYIGFHVLLFSTVFYSTSKRDERVDINAIKNYFYDAEQMLIKKGDACDKYNIVSNDVIKPDVVSPLIDPVFERLKPSHGLNSKPQTGNGKIKDF